MPQLTAWMQAYCIVLSALLGVVMGSFLNCMAIRIVKGEPLARGRSHCMHCGHTLGVGDLVPVFSWLYLRGRCRYCKKRISARYLVAELVGGVVFLPIYLRFGVCWELLEYWIWASLLLCISFADLEGYLVPDRLILVGIGCRVVFLALQGSFWNAALESLAGGLSVSLPLLLVVFLLEKLLKREAMGGGDIKLLFMMGLYCSWKINLLSFLIACLLGVLCGLLLPRLRNREKQFPFGPSIALGGWLGLLFGEQLLTWYLGLFRL